jgi:hypothetical protein
MSLLRRIAGARGRRFTLRKSSSMRMFGGDGGRVLKVSRSERGVVLSVMVKYTKSLVGMTVIPDEVWFGLSPDQRWEVSMSFFKKPGGTPPSGTAGLRLEDKDMLKEAPTLAAYLQEDAWPDGDPRQRSSLLIVCEDGVVKGGLIDKDTDCSLWASAKTFWGILEAMEARLTEDVPDWRKKKAYGKAKRS